MSYSIIARMLRSFIHVSYVGRPAQRVALTDDTPLSTAGLNTRDVLDVLRFAEVTFGFVANPNEITETNLRNIRAMTSYVGRKIGTPDIDQSALSAAATAERERTPSFSSTRSV